jgi:hypothetical protein
MASSKVGSVSAYLKELPADRRKVVEAVRNVVVKNLPKGYSETMEFGMIGYGIPLSKYPDTYNGQPLCYAGLAAQKNHYSLYLMGAYTDPARAKWLEDEFKKRGKKLDMGKSCLRFKSLDDLPLDVVGQAIASTPPEAFIREYEQSRKKA